MRREPRRAVGPPTSSADGGRLGGHKSAAAARGRLLSACSEGRLGQEQAGAAASRPPPPAHHLVSLQHPTVVARHEVRQRGPPVVSAARHAVAWGSGARRDGQASQSGHAWAGVTHHGQLHPSPQPSASHLHTGASQGPHAAPPHLRQSRRPRGPPHQRRPAGAAAAAASAVPPARQARGSPSAVGAAASAGCRAACGGEGAGSGEAFARAAPPGAGGVS